MVRQRFKILVTIMQPLAWLQMSQSCLFLHLSNDLAIPTQGPNIIEDQILFIEHLLCGMHLSKGFTCAYSKTKIWNKNYYFSHITDGYMYLVLF
jgi:hypothetical protein